MLSSAMALAQDPPPIPLHEFPLEFPHPVVGRDALPNMAEIARILAQQDVAPVFIFRVSDSDADYYAPKWSADGKSLAWLKADIDLHTSKIVLMEDVARPDRVVLFNGLDSYDYMFEWSSPDAGHCVFSSTGKRDELNLYMAGLAAEPTPLTTGPSLKKQADLFVSGKEARLLYEDGDKVKLIELKSTAPPTVQEVKDVDFGGYPAWGPDGRSFAFARQRGEQGGRPVYDLSLRRIDLGGEAGTARTLFPGRGLSVRNPVWDPTGERIAFYVGEMKKTWDLYVVRARGQSPAIRIAQDVVTDEIFTSFDAAWDPWGGRIYCIANRHASAGCYPLSCVGVDTGEETVIQYDRSLAVALDVAAAPGREAPELAFTAVQGMARSVYVMILNHF